MSNMSFRKLGCKKKFETSSHERRIAILIIRYRWGVVFVSMIFMGTVISGLHQLTFSSTYRYFFETDNPYLLAYENLGKSYTFNDSLFFVVAPADGQIFTRKTLAIVDELTRSAWQTPYSGRVDSLTNFPHTFADGDNLTVKVLTKNPSALTDAQLEHAKTVILADNQIAHRLISPNGAVAGVFVNIFLPGKSEAELHEVVGFARELADQIEKRYTGIRIRLGGSIMLSDVLMTAVRHDLQKVFPLMYGVVVLVLIAALRSFWPIVAALLVIVLAISAAFGLGGWLGIPMSAISVNAPTLILTVAVANNIHILATFLSRMREGDDKESAIVQSLDINTMPIMVNNIAAGIGFSSLCFNSAPPFRDMGVIVSAGLTAAFFLSIFLLPAMLAILPIHVKPRASLRKMFVERIGDMIIARRTPLFWGMLALILALSMHLPKLQMGEKFTEYFDKRFQFRQDTDFIVKNFTGFDSIEYSLDSGEKRGITRPEYLEKLDRFADWFLKQPETVFVNSLSETIKRLNVTMNGDDQSYYRIPENRNLVAQYLTLYEMSLPAGFDLDTQIRFDESATRFTVVLKDVTNGELLALEQRAQDWLEKDALTENRRGALHAPNILGVVRTPPAGTSPMLLFAHLTQDSARSMLSSGVWTLILISFLLIIPLRSLKYGLISLAPNLAPSAMSYGLWAMMGKPLGLAGSVVATMSLGIVVNDNVHFLCEYVRARREKNMRPEDAVRFAFSIAGVPMWSASIILVAGFALLSFSGFTVNSTMGLLTAITIAFALAADFFFLPPLLLKVEEWSK